MTRAFRQSKMVAKSESENTTLENDHIIQSSDKGKLDRKKIITITSSDALPLSYRRLVGAKDINDS